MTLIRRTRTGRVEIFRSIEDVNRDIFAELSEYYGDHTDDLELAMSQQRVEEPDYLGMVRM